MEPQKNSNWQPDTKKMEALARLSGRIAHDFNNILGAIEGYATLTANTLKEGDTGKADMEEIRQAVKKAVGLTKQLTVFGGRQLLHRAPCDINAIIANTLKRAEVAPCGDFKVEARLEPGLPAVIADAAQLEQALANLLVNAREAMPSGGTAAINSSALRLEGAAVNSSDPLGAGPLFIKISIQDSGAGISVEVLERLFEPLFSTKEKGRGAGLGLSMIYGVVKQHNGWVEVKSTPGRGSEFTLFLPAARQPGVAATG